MIRTNHYIFNPQQNSPDSSHKYLKEIATLPFMSYMQSIVITCGIGITEILQKEIEGLGYEVVANNLSNLEIKGNLRDCMHLNLHLRTASRVLLLIKKFQAAHPDHLYQAISKIPWEDHINSNGYISVTSHIQNSYILDTRFGNQKVKDAIVDRMISQQGKRPDSGPTRDQTVIYLHWVDTDCHLYFDTSGETISKHGYRRIPFKAPLRESLAAAIIKSSKWKPGIPLINPMAGSGTLAIEAGMIACKIAPGLIRENFGFMHLKSYQEDLWIQMKIDAKKLIDKNQPQNLLVNDSSLEALRAAKKNAAWAGVESLIEFHHGDFTQVKIPEEPAVVILNPEYGERMGDIDQLIETYAKIGDFFKEKCAGSWGYIFSGNPDLSKKIGLRTSRKIPFFNGKIECRLLEYELYRGSKKI